MKAAFTFSMLATPLTCSHRRIFSRRLHPRCSRSWFYNGPDATFQGKEIAFACNENTVTIADVSDPSDAYMIGASTYSNSQYTHQGWLTEDQRYFLVGDELDEYYDGINTTTFIWDVLTLNCPTIHWNFVSTTSAIDHNLYIVGDLCYQSNYRAGLRIADISNVANGIIEEVAYFDIYLKTTMPNLTALGLITLISLPA